MQEPLFDIFQNPLNFHLRRDLRDLGVPVVFIPFDVLASRLRLANHRWVGIFSVLPESSC
jgi:hypothetical protein